MIYNLNVLDDEANVVNYDYGVDKNGTNRFQISFCFPLNEILQLMDDEDRLLIERNRTILVPALLNLSALSLNREFNLTIDEANSYFFNNHSCFLIEIGEFEKADYFRTIEYKLFPYSRELTYDFYQMIFLHRRDGQNIGHLVIEKSSLHHRNNKFFQCVDNRTMNGGRMQYTFLNCFNECVKNVSKKVFYRYENDEQVAINFDDTLRSLVDEDECIGHCPQSECQYDYYNYNNRSKGDQEGIQIEKTAAHFKAYFAIDRMDFYLQYIGLIALFMNISIIQIAPLITKRLIEFVWQFAASFQIRFINMQKLLLSSRILVNVLCACLFGSLSFLVISEFVYSINNPKRSLFFYFSTDFNPISLIFCIPVQLLLMYNVSAFPTKSREVQMLEKIDFASIERETNDGLLRIVDKIYLAYASRDKYLQWNVSEQVLFRTSSYGKANDSTKLNLLERCFRVEFELKETSYERYLFLSKIKIRYKNHSISTLYIVSRTDEFLSDSYKFDYRFDLTVWIGKSTLNCTNYFETDFDCRSRQHCIEKCIQKRFISTHSSLTTGIVIDKAELRPLNLSEFYFNSSIDKRIVNKCENQFTLMDCTAKKWSKNHKYVHGESSGERMINLYHPDTHNYQSNFSYQKLFFKLLNVLSIIYGININGLLCIVLALKSFKTNFKLYYSKFVFNLCFVGLIGHLSLILYEIITDEYTYTSYFTKDETLVLPEIAFCFPIDKHVLDKNEGKLITGNHLNKMTSNLTIQSVIERIDYLDELGNYTRIKSMSDQEMVRFKSYFFLNLKCFEISLKIEYREKRVYFLDNIYTLKIYLNKTNLPALFYFAIKRKNSKEFDGLFRSRSEDKIRHRFKIEILKQELIDQFKFLKHPISSLYDLIYGSKANNLTEYFDEMLQQFKVGYNLTTSLIALEDEYFAYEIEDRLFHQYYMQVQQPIDSLTRPNFFTDFTVSEFVFFHDFIDPNQTEPDFEIASSFFIYHTRITNEQNLIKFLQDVLNAANLWMNLSNIDLHVFFDAIVHYIIRSYAHLQTLKSHLKSELILFIGIGDQ